MKQLEPLILIQSSPGVAPNVANKISISSNTEMAPLFSFSQEERLDAFLAKLQRAYESNEIGDITTSAVMELYEYKVVNFYVIHFIPNGILHFILTIFFCNSWQQ